MKVIINPLQNLSTAVKTKSGCTKFTCTIFTPIVLVIVHLRDRVWPSHFFSQSVDHTVLNNGFV